MKTQQENKEIKLFKEFARRIARDLRGLGFEAKRLWDVRFEKGGTDLVAVREDLELAIQCKYGKPNMKKVYLEAVSAREKGQIALGICRFRNERDTLVCLSWGDFKRLINLLRTANEN